MATSLPNIVCVSAPSRHSGKGTVAGVLIREYRYVQFNFATPIKTMWTALCMIQGVDRDIIGRTLTKDLKETPLPEVAGLSLRTFAEGIGTTWGRNMVREDMWVDMARPTLKALLAKGQRIVIEDARFANECNLARELGGVVVNVVRPVFNGGVLPTLASEGHLLDYDFDWTFTNTGTIAQLHDQVRWYFSPANVKPVYMQPAPWNSDK